MGFFGAFVRTTVNLVKLPVALPVAVAKDTLRIMTGDETREVKKVVKELKDESDY